MFDDFFKAIFFIGIVLGLLGAGAALLISKAFKDDPPLAPDIKCDKFVEKLIDGNVYRIKTGCTIRELIK